MQERHSHQCHDAPLRAAHSSQPGALPGQQTETSRARSGLPGPLANDLGGLLASPAPPTSGMLLHGA
eukprot:10893453-Lingulodinium_polyedra.AAC.1